MISAIIPRTTLVAFGTPKCEQREEWFLLYLLHYNDNKTTRSVTAAIEIPFVIINSTNRHNSMWKTTPNNKLIWTDENKMFLLSQIRSNLIVNSPESSNRVLEKKEKAWQKIYKKLVQNGMPDMPLGRLKFMWSIQKRNSINRYQKYEASLRRNSVAEEPNELDKKVFDIIEATKNMHRITVMVMAAMRIIHINKIPLVVFPRVMFNKISLI